MENQNENQATQTKDNQPEFRLSMVRQTSTDDQWANIGVGWYHKDGKGITFSSDLLKMFGFKIVATPIKSQN